MKSQTFPEFTEADIAAALESTSFLGWPADEGDLLELVNILGGAAPTADPELSVERLIGTASEPYGFLAGVR